MKTSEKERKGKPIGGMSYLNRLFLLKKGCLNKMQAVKKAILCAIYLHPKETVIGNNTFLFPFCCPKGAVLPEKQLFYNRCFFYPFVFHSIVHCVSDNPIASACRLNGNSPNDVRRLGY